MPEDDTMTSGMCPPADMHCHPGFSADALSLVLEANWPLLAMTVDPREFESTCHVLEPAGNVRVAAGLHPWWISDSTCGEHELDLLLQLIETTRFIGEVGLDFANRHAGSERVQAEAFDRIVCECSRNGDKVLSIHALRSADAVLDILEAHRACETCTCILHWFSGTSDQLHRAIKMGCYFSVNDRLMSTGRGREYAKVMPLERVLLETDLPSQPGASCNHQDMRSSLEQALATIESVKRQPCHETISATSARILGLPTR